METNPHLTDELYRTIGAEVAKKEFSRGQWLVQLRKPKGGKSSSRAYRPGFDISTLRQTESQVADQNPYSSPQVEIVQAELAGKPAFPWVACVMFLLDCVHCLLHWRSCGWCCTSAGFWARSTRPSAAGTLLCSSPIYIAIGWVNYLCIRDWRNYRILAARSC